MYTEMDACGLLVIKIFAIIIFFEQPVAQSRSTRYVVMEEDERGTEIGILKKDLEMGESGSRFLFIEQPHICLINLREADGQLSIGQRLDREELCHRSPRCMLPLDVVASYNDSFHLIHVEIEVQDINDHSPLFLLTDTYFEVTESASLGTRFPIEIASDKDIGQNDIQNYYISSNNHFDIKEHMDESGDRYADLMLVTELDREREDTLTILVMAMDGGCPPKSGILTVHVKILDFNDNNPSFIDDFVSVDVYEDTLVGVLISQLNATDPDEGKNGEIVFAFAEHTPADIQNVFTIDSLTGRLVLARGVDFEITPFYEFRIKAFDLGLNSVPAVCTVRINILDVNDNFPLIFIKPLEFDKVVYISEHAAEGSFVAVIRTMDSDSGLSGQVSCSLHGHEHFRLQKANGSNIHILMTTTHLDRETQPEYNLTLVAMDFGSPRLKTITEFTVRVSDENDNAPIFDNVVYEVWVEENNVVGEYLMSVLAFDADLGQNADITYKLADGQSHTILPSSTQFVSIDALSGSLYALETFDYEQIKDIKVKVQASDSGYPELSTTALVWIRIADKNDCPPVITYPHLVNDVAFAFWAPDASSDKPLMQIKAKDADEGLNAELKFVILEDTRKLFAVNQRTGNLYLQGTQSNPSEKILQVEVGVTDKGIPPLMTKVKINVIITGVAPSTWQTTVISESTGLESNQLTVESCLTQLICFLLLTGFILVLTLGFRAAFRRGHYSTIKTKKETLGIGQHIKMSWLGESSSDLIRSCASVNELLLKRELVLCKDTFSTGFEDQQSTAPK